MMKKILLALHIGFIALSCDDKNRSAAYDVQLPADTQTGANTFGAVIGGKIMVPRTPTGYSPPGSQKAAVRFTEDTTYCEISAGDSKTPNAYIYIFIKNANNSLPLSVGKYFIGDSNGELNYSSAQQTLITVLVYKNDKTVVYSSIENTGNIYIKRSDRDVISGSFSCRLKNQDNPSETVDLKDGRFDFTKATIYNTLFP